MKNNFFVAIAKFENGEKVALTFDDYDGANNYYNEHGGSLVWWTLLKYQNNAAKIIHDCAGDAYQNLKH
jgi:hypothetical protein